MFFPPSRYFIFLRLLSLTRYSGGAGWGRPPDETSASGPEKDDGEVSLA